METARLEMDVCAARDADADEVIALLHEATV